ncbi:hypothetical protein [Sporosarcina globispora]|nr:hypothetical protein [Sporosarcina globispora]
MKVEINGELIAPEGMTHEELLDLLFSELKSKGVHFRGETKQGN